MYTIYQAQSMMHRVYAERLRYAELRRTRSAALRRSRIRSTLRRAIEAGLRYGIDPHEVEREFDTTLRQVMSR
jgi:hypothetical protein